MSEFKKTPVSTDDQNTIKKHLEFIQHVTNISINSGYRAVLSGGYAVDGILGMITRPHVNINILLYGKDVLTPKLLRDSILVKNYSSYTIKEKERSLYWHEFHIPEVQANLYYFRVATEPFSETTIIVGSDDVYSEEEDFNTRIIILKGVRYEVRDAVTELANKIYKRDYQAEAKLPKYDQDIHNLSLIADSYDLQSQLNKLIKNQSIAL
jgi:hypothetical protein